MSFNLPERFLRQESKQMMKNKREVSLKLNTQDRKLEK